MRLRIERRSERRGQTDRHTQHGARIVYGNAPVAVGIGKLHALGRHFFKSYGTSENHSRIVDRDGVIAVDIAERICKSRLREQQYTYRRKKNAQDFFEL